MGTRRAVHIWLGAFSLGSLGLSNMEQSPWESSESETSVTDATLGVPSEVASDSMTDGPGSIARGPLACNVCLPTSWT